MIEALYKEGLSWYPSTKLNSNQIRYLKLLQEIFYVMDGSGEWVSYTLTPHQIHWHSEDIACKFKESKDRLVKKSRNTSFTVSSSISNLMAVPFFPDNIVPVVRLNMKRAVDLISEIKQLVKHMKPIKLSVPYIDVEGKQQYKDILFPFNPNEVNLENKESIFFPNGVEFRAMPANADSAESIRGMRIMGSAGIIDESNFMRYFKDIYIALRDAARGSKDGERMFQMNIGTTRKGRLTPFNLWFESIMKTKPDNLLVFDWPVLKHPLLDLNKSLIEQSKMLNLIPIVPWHDIKLLEQKRREDLNTFKEEYMGELVDAEEQFYKYDIFSQCIDENLKSYDRPIPGEVYSIGIDPAGGEGGDFFTISIFEKNKKEQRHLFYTKTIELPIMEQKCKDYIKLWKPNRVVIDGNGLGYQLAQELRREFGVQLIKIIRGVFTIKTAGRVTGGIPIKEYLHTNQNKMFNYKEMTLLADEVQIKHYMMWKNDYSCDHDSELGHGDIVIANGLALLPDNFRHIDSNKLDIVRQKEVEDIKIKEVELVEPDVEW